jgi:hypothetical protein
MKNIKILLVSMLSLLLVSAANAGELSVTGSVKASITTAGGDSAGGDSVVGGRALAVSNDIDFNASGELDNGWTWKWQTQLDAGAIDDTQLTISTPQGTIGLYGTEGGLNFKHGGSQMALGYGSQIGNAAGFLDPDDVGSFNNVQYHTPAGLLPFGTTVKAAVTMGGSATSEPGDSPLGTTVTESNGRSYQVEITEIPMAEGLKIGASYFTIDQNADTNQAGQKEENGAYYASYKVGPVGIGYSKAYVAPSNAKNDSSTTGLYNYYENTSYSIGFVVNDNLSVSYGNEKSHRNLITDATEYDIKIDTIQAAYTMGGMTATIGVKDIENGNYDQNQNTNEAHFVLSMAF